MKRIVAQYTVKPGAEESVEAVVRTFVRAVRDNEPNTDYQAFRLADSRSFLHVMTFTNEASHQIHRDAAYTLKLVEGLYPLCEGEPTFTPLAAIE